VNAFAHDAKIDKERSDVLTWLDPPSNRRPPIACKDPETNGWFLTGEVFKSWLGGTQSFIFLHGGVGCGKTTLNRAVVEVLEARDVGITAFYFSSTIQQRQELNDLLRLIAANLCPTDRLPASLMTLYQKYQRRFPPESPDNDHELGKLVEELLLNDRKSKLYYILIDGLDETVDSQRRDVIKYLNTLAANRAPGLQVLVTARPAQLQASFPTELWRHESMPTAMVRNDIKVYMQNRMAKEMALAALDPTLRNTIFEKLAGEGQSMFRYAFLQLERLLNNGVLLSRNAVAILKQLPDDINDTYSAILDEIDRHDEARARKMLMWVAYARQPFSVEELGEACAITPSNDNVYNEADRLSTGEVLALLSDLIVLEPFEHAGQRLQFVVFAHSSVKEYCLGDMPPATAVHFGFSEAESQSLIASSCIAILGQLMSGATCLLTAYAYDAWPLHTIFAYHVERTNSKSHHLYVALRNRNGEGSVTEFYGNWMTNAIAVPIELQAILGGIPTLRNCPPAVLRGASVGSRPIEFMQSLGGALRKAKFAFVRESDMTDQSRPEYASLFHAARQSLQLRSIVHRPNESRSRAIEDKRQRAIEDKRQELAASLLKL
jgi:hypothetical protein